MEQLAQRIIVLIEDRLPKDTKEYIATLEKEMAVMRSELEQLRADRGEVTALGQRLESLREACLRWHKDNYSPRLHSVIDVFLRQEVSRR